MASERWQVGDLTIDVGGQSVMRNGETIALPQLSFKFLLTLVQSAPNLVTVDDLMERVWSGIFVNNETVKQRAKLLRDALGDDPRNPRYFAVRRGVGYQLLPPSRRLDGAAQRERYRPRWRNAVAAMVLGLTGLAGLSVLQFFQSDRTATPASAARIAVLPFDNLSGDPADAYIARAIPEMVLNRLSSIRGLAVISRESSMLSIAANAAPADAGAKLHADYVVTGSVQRSGSMLRVTCFVVDVGSDTRLWSEYFDWPIDRIYALQDRIADHVAVSLETKVRGIGALPPAAVQTRNTDAYLAYLKGASLLGRLTVAETDAAAEQFERAVRLDPNFTQAMVALYDARMQGADLRKDDLEPVRTRYQPLLNRALQIEPGSGSALFAMAMWSNRPPSERKELFQRAVERDPSNSRGLTAYAQFVDRYQNRANSVAGGGETGPSSSEAKALLDRVLAIDPLSPVARFWAIQRRWSSSTPDEVMQAMARELELDPQNYILANRYAFRRWYVYGETADALEKIERGIASDPQQPIGPNIAVAAYLDAGDAIAARAVAETTPATRQSSRILLAQYRGDWRAAGDAAFGSGGYRFNVYQSWNWPQAIRDHALHTRQYDRGARAIAERFGFDLADPRTANVTQIHAAAALAHILLAAGKRRAAERLLAGTVQWIDAHPKFGLPVHMRVRATAMMLLGNRTEALSNLRASVEAGHDIRHWWYVVEHDPTWEPVRNDPRFAQIAAYCRKAAAQQRAKLDMLRRQGKVPVRTRPARV